MAGRWLDQRLGTGSCGATNQCELHATLQSKVDNPVLNHITGNAMCVGHVKHIATQTLRLLPFPDDDFWARARTADSSIASCFDLFGFQGKGYCGD